MLTSSGFLTRNWVDEHKSVLCFVEKFYFSRVAMSKRETLATANHRDKNLILVADGQRLRGFGPGSLAVRGAGISGKR